jgi:hypothetical protein
MARSPSSGIAALLTAPVSQPGFLVQIVVGATTHRLCTMDADFTYGGHTWTAADVQVSGLSWDTGGVRAARLTLGDVDLAWWTATLNLTLQDAPVSIWQVYVGATNEAEPLWSGRIGAVRKGEASVDCDLTIDATLLRSPRRRVQNLVDSQFLISPGTIVTIGGQEWIVERA